MSYGCFQNFGCGVDEMSIDEMSKRHESRVATGSGEIWRMPMVKECLGPKGRCSTLSGSGVKLISILTKSRKWCHETQK